MEGSSFSFMTSVKVVSAGGCRIDPARGQRDLMGAIPSQASQPSPEQLMQI